VHGASRADWDRAWESVARAADKTRHPRLTAGVSFVVTSWNQDGVSEAAVRARDAGADYIHVRPAFEGPHSQMDRQLTPAESEARIRELDVLTALETSTFRVHGIRRRFEELERVDRTAIHCRTTPLVSYVLPTGDVSLCTLVRDASFNAAVPDPFLGNVYNAPFFDLWGTPRHRSLIAALSRSGCHRCHFAEYNRALEAVEQDVHHASFL
jgi:MoaA/NifB/PqqE/SkfB family radical SAM enzyme